VPVEDAVTATAGPPVEVAVDWTTGAGLTVFASPVGVAVGFAEGVDNGAAVGVDNGATVGFAAGVDNGAAVGVDNGATVGFAAGVDNGAAVGAAVGATVGVASGADRPMPARSRQKMDAAAMFIGIILLSTARIKTSTFW